MVNVKEPSTLIYQRCQTLLARAPSPSPPSFFPCAAATKHMVINLEFESSDRVFVHALNTVKRIPRTGSARPPPSARLKLYGLYKQSMEGDVERVMSRPPQGRGVDEAEREKW